MEIVQRVNREKPTWNLLGFIAHDEKTFQEVKTVNGLPVLGGPGKIKELPQASLVPTNEWPKAISLPYQQLVSLIDPSVFMSRTATIGVGCVFYPNCFIGDNAKIGDFVFSLSGSIVNHDNVIGDRVVITSGVTLAGHVHVEEGCYLGQACNIKQYLKIGRNSFIGMGSVVLKEVPPNCVMVGNPARKLKDRA